MRIVSVARLRYQTTRKYSMSFCKDCVKGVTHEGTPQGKIVKIGGVDSYIATPEVDYPKSKVVLFLTDVFGIALQNNKLLCDDFAKNGFKTIAPDFLNGDPIPADAMSKGGFDIAQWKTKHGAEQTRPSLNKVIKALKEEGVESFAAVGYCFGARYVFDLAFENIISVAAVAHPSQLTVPQDLEKYASDSKAPLLINSCTVDQAFPLESQAKADEIFGNDNFKPGYKREYFEGCTHGFAVRGDISNAQVKAGKEGAFKATVEWFQKYL